MKIKHFIVTYNNNHLLNESLRTIFDGIDESQRNILEVFIINNHTNLNVDDRFINEVKVLHNQTRPDFSTGHLARDWNSAIINGFCSLKNPQCDILITSQNDVEFFPNYIETVVDLHKKYRFTSREDDPCVTYSPYAVKRVGLWDERFCNIGYQEMDYFSRVKTYLKPSEYKFFTPYDNPIIKFTPTGAMRKDIHHLESSGYHYYTKKLFEVKQMDKNMKSYIQYPYFELDVETLQEQNYFF